MNREELYHKTVNVLLDAYNDGELEHGDCYACAVGNICSMVEKDVGIERDEWGSLFQTSYNIQDRFYRDLHDLDGQDARRLVAATGYSVEELAQIEYAFESSIYYKWKDGQRAYHYYTEENPKKGQFIGLCAVLDVLKEIHKVNEETHTEKVESLTKVYERITA